jgi:tetratricopeptide (TPR) repeat protein
MTGIDFARVREAFDRAAAAPPGHPERDAAFDSLPAAERDELRSLLAAHDDHGTCDDLRRRVDGAAAATLPGADRRQRMGPWRITGELGEGGMGVVLSAVRDDGEFAQRAAIKVVRGFPSEDARERLRRERQILADLEHPNIARLLDGGTSHGGEPYLVMEHVDGEPLPAWLARGPALRARIRLFASICRAVAFAHQRLVVHRDLKPGNVMVRVDGVPVLLDFGIAKLLEAKPGGDRTRTHAITPAYASPEQLRGEPVTTAADIFGLGLILYVLLGGDVASRSDPVKSATTTVDSASEAARRSADPAARAFAPMVRGDLDAIVRLATRIDPNRRYASAVLLQQDVEAWLDGRPVTARAGDRWYQLAKFTRRHRAALVFGALLVAGAATFTARLAVERDRAQTAQAQAESEAATSREVLAFVTGLFGELDPMRGGDAQITAAELLDRGRARLDSVQTSSPYARAALQRALGDIYRNGERPREAIALLTAAREEYLRNPTQANALVEIEVAIAQAHNALLDPHSAEPYITQALARAAARGTEDPKTLAHTLMTHGVTQQRLGRSDAAMADFERAQALFEQSGEAGREGLASVLHNRGWVADSRDEPALALDWYRQAVARKTALLGADHPSTLNSRFASATALAALGRFAEAEGSLLDLLPDIERRLGTRSAQYARLWNELGSVRQDLGRWPEAVEAYRRAIALDLEGAAGAAGVTTAQTINNLASLDEERGDLAAAERGYRESLAIRLRVLAETSPAVARARHNLARVLLRAGRVDEAATLAAAARAAREAILPPGSPERLVSQALAVEILLARGEVAAATREAEALAAATPRSRAQARTVAAAQRALAAAAAARGDAATRVTALEAARAALRDALPTGHPAVALAELDLAEVLGPDRAAEAARLRAAAIPVLDVALAGDSPDRRRLLAPVAAR